MNLFTNSIFFRSRLAFTLVCLFLGTWFGSPSKTFSIDLSLRTDEIELDQNGNIPVIVHVALPEDHSIAIDERTIREDFHAMEQYFDIGQQNPFRFSIEAIHYDVKLPFLSDTNFDMEKDRKTTRIMNHFWQDPEYRKKINVVYIFSASGDCSGKGALPEFPTPQAVIINYSTEFDSKKNALTLTHEMGHFFGLYHTHDYFGFPGLSENVSREECNELGDKICDTSADPDLYDRVRTDCFYAPEKRIFDSKGVEITSPPIDNIMSYSPYQCKRGFTAQQKNRMLATYKERIQPMTSVQKNSTEVGDEFTYTFYTSKLLHRMWAVVDPKYIFSSDYVPEFSIAVYDSKRRAINPKMYKIDRQDFDFGIVWRVKILKPGTYLIGVTEPELDDEFEDDLLEKVTVPKKEES